MKPSTLMLTDDEKIKIRAEEIFRQEIQRDLKASKPPSSLRRRAWAALNSSFALWFLSSVVLAGFTSVFSCNRDRRDREEKRADLEQRLDVEISNRISQALAGVRIDRVRHQNGQIFAPDAYYTNATRYLNNSFIFDLDNRQDFSLYTEFQTRGFRALIFELATVVKTSEKSQLQEVLGIYEKLADLASVHEDKVAKEAALQALETSTLLLDQMRELRWTRTLQ